MECCGVGVDLKDDLVPTPCHGQEYLPLDQVARGLIQPGFEHFQGWGIHELPNQSVPVSCHPHGKTFLLMLNLNFPSFKFEIILLLLFVLSPQFLMKSLPLAVIRSKVAFDYLGGLF